MRGGKETRKQNLVLVSTVGVYISGARVLLPFASSTKYRQSVLNNREGFLTIGRPAAVYLSVQSFTRCCVVWVILGGRLQCHV